MDRDVLIGGSVAAAVVAIALAVVIFVFVRRQWSHSEERKLRLRAKLSGLAFDDDEVCSRDTTRYDTLYLYTASQLHLPQGTKTSGRSNNITD